MQYAYSCTHGHNIYINRLYSHTDIPILLDEWTRRSRRKMVHVIVAGDIVIMEDCKGSEEWISVLKIVIGILCGRWGLVFVELLFSKVEMYSDRFQDISIWDNHSYCPTVTNSFIACLDNQSILTLTLNHTINGHLNSGQHSSCI